jgi:CelD/BcsL family acetyltransferase involved in cellulose biosynthesis
MTSVGTTGTAAPVARGPLPAAGAGAAPLVVESIDSADRLRDLRPAWEGLLAHCPGHALGVTPLWLGTWWELFGAGRELRILAARSPAGELVGLAPLLRRRVRHRGLVPFRRFELLGAGEPQPHHIGSDYLDFITHGEWEPAATRALCAELFRRGADEWDEALFCHLPGDSPRVGAIEDQARGAGLHCERLEVRSGVTIPLPETWEALLRSLSSDRRKQLLRRRRRLAEAGTVGFSWEVTAASFEAQWATVVDLHQRRWAAAGRPGCFSSPQFTAFHRQVAQALLPVGGVRLAILTLDGRPLACDFYYLYQDRVYAYQAGLDPQDGFRLSAGTLCISYGIEAAISAGLGEYDFLKGVHSYKADWSSVRREQVTLRVSKPGLREAARSALEAGVRATRPLRRRLSAPKAGAAPRGPGAERGVMKGE